MTCDVLLVTVECARWDYRDHLRPAGDLEATEAITAGHYTRPSLAAVHAPTWPSVMETRLRGPTLAETFADAGYQTAAIAHSPQTTAAFGFGRGFDDARLCEPDGGPVGRGSALRERLSSLGPVRWVHNQFGGGKHAVFDGIPTDGQVVAEARELLATADRPLFLWVHLMGPHRPYGWDADALDPDLSKALATAGSGGLVERDPAELRARVLPAYTDALGRASEHLSSLLAATDDDTVVAIAGDHGEELGESGYYLHAGYRQRVVDTLVDVPVFTRNVSIHGPVSLMDLGAHLTDAAGIAAPEAWAARRDRETFVTLAPWSGTATIRVQTSGSGVDMTLRDATLPAGEVDVGRDVEQQLAALGYRGVG